MAKRKHPFVQKADYVLGEKKKAEKSGHRHHTCHWPGCGKQVPPAMWGCRTCWYRLPMSIRNRIWAAYRPGQEKDLNPSEEYMKAAQAAQDWIRDNYKGKKK